MSSTSFSIKDDLKVAYWSEPDDLFMLGFSTLGGADVLGNSAKSWISLSDYVTSVEIDNGTQVEQGVLNYPKAGNCSVSMLGDELSSFVNRSLRAGTFVSVGLRPTDATADMTNTINNPKPSTFTGTNTLWYVSARGAGAASTSAITGGYWVDTITSASASASYTWNVGSLSDVINQGFYALPSTIYTASVYLTSSINDNRSLSIKWYNGAGTLISTSSATTVALTANVETRASVTATAPAGTSYAALHLDTVGSSVIRTVGSTMKMRKAFMDEGSSTLRSYFDGDTPPDYRYGSYWDTNTPDASPSTLVFQQPTLFIGRIKTVDTIYPLEGPAQVSINATDFLEDFLAYNVTSYDLPAYWAASAPFDSYQSILPAFEEYYGSALIDGSSGYQFGLTSSSPSAVMQDLSDPVVLGSDNVSVSNIVNSALDCELGMITMDYDNDFSGSAFYSVLAFHPRNSVYGSNDDLVIFRRNYFSAGNTGSPDAYVNDIQLYSTTNELANKVIATLAWDDAVKVTDKNQDSIDLYGELSTERSLNLWNSYALTLWAKALNEYSPVKYVRSVAGVAATPNTPIGAFAYMKPSDLLNVKFTRTGLSIDESYRIVNVNHSISVDEWNTTVELWKGN
jgi:hypothetical protein